MPRLPDDRSRDDRSQPLGAARLDRRCFLAYTLSLTAGTLLIGCGGSDVPAFNSVVNPDSFLVPANRTEPTGSLPNQIDQFSEAVDALSLAYAGSTADLSRIESLVSSATVSGAASRAAIRQAEQGSLEGAGTLFSLSNAVLPVLQETYERTINASLMLDQVGYLGDRVSAANNLVGGASVANPQWVAAMMERNYHATNLMGSLMEFYQINGITQMTDSVREQTDADTKLVAYTLLADAFNRWSSGVASAARTRADASLLLDVSDAVTPSTVDTQLNRIAAIVARLPLGPGYRPALTRSSLQTVGEFAQDTAESFLGTVAENFLEAGNNGTSYSLRRSAIVTTLSGYLEGGAGLLRNLSRGFGLDVVTGLATNALTSFLENRFGARGQYFSCVIKIGTGTADLIKNVGLFTATATTGLGAVVFGALTLGSALDLADDIRDCLDPLAAPLLAAMMPSAQAYDRSSGNPGRVRDIPALTNPRRAESDQLSSAAVSPRTIPVPASDTQPPASLTDITADDVRKFLCGALGSSRAFGGVPRTYTNVLIATAGLILDHARRNPNTVQGQLNGNTLNFFASDFAVLVRREAGATRARVPAITNADLLCSAPGFVPKRSTAPMNLNVMDSLPLLRSLTELGTGVNVGAN